MRKVQIALLALIAGTLTLNSTANAEGWFTEMDDAREVTLADVIRNPEAYIDVDVRIKVYFNNVGGTYNPYFTRFTEEMYGNFSAWPIDARLYERRDFERSYGYFFCQRSKDVWRDLRSTKQLTSIEVLGAVRETFKGQPWIEIHGFKVIDDGMTKSDVRNVVAGDAYALAGRHDDAVAHYEKAASTRLPRSVQADVYRKLADARYHSGDYDGAVDAYHAAQRSVPDSVVLKRGVDASKAAHERARAQEKGKAFKALAVVPAPSTEPVIEGHKNGVDAIIQLMEDPAKVEAEVAEWRIQLEKRAASVRDGAKVEVVAGDKADDASDEAKEAAPKDDAEVVVTPESTDTADVDVDGCGCATDTSDGEVEVEADGCGCAADVETEEVETVEEAEGCGDAGDEGCGDVEEVEVEESADETEGCGAGSDVEVEVEVEKVDDTKKTDEVEKADDTKKTDVVEKVVDTNKTVEVEKVDDTKKTDVVEKADDTKKTDVVEKVVDTNKTDVVEKVVDTNKTDVVEKADDTNKTDVVEKADDTEQVEETEEVEVEVEVEDSVDSEEVDEAVEVEKADETVETTVDPSRNTVKVKQPDATDTSTDVAPSRGTVQVKQPDAAPANDTTANKVVVKAADDAAKADVVEVADRSVTIPRLPFFGCEDVTSDDLRALLDELARNPER